MFFKEDCQGQGGEPEIFGFNIFALSQAAPDTTLKQGPLRTIYLKKGKAIWIIEIVIIQYLILVIVFILLIILFECFINDIFCLFNHIFQILIDFD